MTKILDTYEASIAAKLIGFGSVAMLDYLQRSGIFKPIGKRGARGRGRKRAYEFRDLIVLKAIKRLLNSGASVASLKRALSEFQKVNWIADPVTMEGPSGIIRYLIASNDRIFLARDTDLIVDLSRKGQLTFSFIIDLENLRDELRTSLGMPQLQHELALPINQSQVEKNSAVR